MDIYCKFDHITEWYCKLNMRMTVPSLKYNDTVMMDSKEIIQHIA